MGYFRYESTVPISTFGAKSLDGQPRNLGTRLPAYAANVCELGIISKVIQV